MSACQVLQVFTAIGAVVALKAASNFTFFLYYHLLSPSKYTRYLYRDAPYALVTGATDGIGKAIAGELYDKGFNLIIHGRNPEKLHKVRDEILSRPGVGHKDVRLWVADASTPETLDFASAVKEWEDVQITLVVHNVGGGRVWPNRIDAIPKETLLAEFNLNAIFPWLLTRALLPKLRASSGPVELVFVGSGTDSFPMPGIVPTSTGKAFIRQLSLSISADEQFRQPTNVTTSYLNIGGVASDQRGRKPSLFEPAPQEFAKSVVAKIGSGRSVIVPWIWHAPLVWIIQFVPESVFRRMLRGIAETEIAAKDKHD